MSVVASELIVYGAQNIAETDGVTQGGAIDETVRYVFDDSTLANTLNDTLEVLSDNAGDTTQTVTVTGRNSAGSIITENFSLNGTTVQNGATTFERILKVVMSATAVGNVTVRKAADDTAVATLEPGVTSVRRPFYDVSSDAAGGSSRDFYEKVFVKNTNASNALLNAVIKENADSLSKITFDLEDAQNDNESIASRLNTPPTGLSSGVFNDADKPVPGTDLGTSSQIGVWLKLTLAAGDAANKGTWTMQIDGSTT